jgi:hypothetical protein
MGARGWDGMTETVDLHLCDLLMLRWQEEAGPSHHIMLFKKCPDA